MIEIKTFEEFDKKVKQIERFNQRLQKLGD